MRGRRQHLRWAGVLLGLIVALTGCTYAAMQRLSLDEQAEFYLYRKAMTGAQERAYLAQATAAEPRISPKASSTIWSARPMKVRPIGSWPTKEWRCSPWLPLACSS